MQRFDHVLRSQSLGSQKTLSSFHFGTPGARPKVYIQASLHAEELPGMLAAHHLRRLLEQAEALGQIQGEVVLVPMANPIGLAQRVDHKPMGRFDLNTSENFNRHYPDLCAAVWPQVQNKLGPDAAANVETIRQAIGAYLDSWQPGTEIASQRKYLVSLAYDADVVLDLHCDCEAVLHLYTETPCWPAFEPLARLLGAQAVLLAKGSGGLSFDECLSGVWWQLADKYAETLPDAATTAPIPQACISTTVELRGELDVSHALASADASAIRGYLQHLGVVGGTAPALPDLACAATPLAGAQFVKSPVPGVLVFAAKPGDRLAVGDLIAEIIDPIHDSVHALRAEVPGVMYARTLERYATPEDDLANIAGSVAFRTGNLLGA
ncbi:succinylglutamate desuccinylase/aspartoacylase family protein [Rhodoferax sp.]|uniref:succinylglutamate desuccinylase/aspartoacylase family protein n=1 Tax=Rhodoferax sp. TaxID=50421 RepID=UPI00374CD1DC